MVRIAIYVAVPWLLFALVMCNIAPSTRAAITGWRYAECDGSVVNLLRDNRHCGRCFNACSSDTTCAIGKCRDQQQCMCFPSSALSIVRNEKNTTGAAPSAAVVYRPMSMHEFVYDITYESQELLVSSLLKVHREENHVCCTGPFGAARMRCVMGTISTTTDQDRHAEPDSPSDDLACGSCSTQCSPDQRCLHSSCA